MVVPHLVLPVPAVADVVAHQVGADTEEGVALKSICAAKCLRVLESRDNESEAVVLGAPAVCLVSQGDEVGPGDDEPLGPHRAGLGVTGDVGLEHKLGYYLLLSQPFPFPLD